MVEMGIHPILWHGMEQHDHFGFKEFAFALGCDGEHIERYTAGFRASRQLGEALVRPVSKSSSEADQAMAARFRWDARASRLEHEPRARLFMAGAVGHG
jgi:hypothetical protein